jgi:hypothetical protein
MAYHSGTSRSEGQYLVRITTMIRCISGILGAVE